MNKQLNETESKLINEKIATIREARQRGDEIAVIKHEFEYCKLVEDIKKGLYAIKN